MVREIWLRMIRTTLLLDNVGLPLLGLDGAKDDVHLLQGPAFRLGDDPMSQESCLSVMALFVTADKTHAANVAMPPMLIAANMRNSLKPKAVTMDGVTLESTKLKSH